MPFISPDQVVIPEGRYRSDFSSVQSRANDIRKVGQLVPILCRRDESGNLILVDGECRTRACKLLEREVWYTTNEDGKILLDDEFHHRQAELMCNLSRDDMLPIDKAKGIADLDRLLKEELGQKGTNAIRDDGQEGHSSADTAKMLGYKTRKTVTDAIMIAKAAEEMPELSEAKSTAEALRMIGVRARLEIQTELARRRADAPQNGPIQDLHAHFSERLILGDCLEGMKGMQSGTATIFLTDIPYGIEYKSESDSTDKSENKDITKKILGFYEDSPEKIIPLVESIIQQMARVGRPNCYAYMFCAFRYWSYLSGVFKKNGFDVYNKPIIWIKGSLEKGRLGNGVCRLPAKWPASVSDCIIFASRGNVELFRQGLPDVIISEPILTSEKVHNVQRPVSLLTELISRVFHPGTKGLLIDPFAGSGSSLAAAMHFDGLSYAGFELDQDNRERGITYLINEYHRMQQPEDEFGELEL